MNHPIPAERYNSVLDALISSIPEIEAAALVSPDGLMISSVVPTNLNEDMLGTLSAAILSLGKRIAWEFESSSVIEQVYVKGEKGHILLSGVANKALLVIVANKDAKLGMIFLAMKQAAEALLL